MAASTMRRAMDASFRLKPLLTWVGVTVPPLMLEILILM